jgi:hypothetical protein
MVLYKVGMLLRGCSVENAYLQMLRGVTGAKELCDQIHIKNIKQKLLRAFDVLQLSKMGTVSHAVLFSLWHLGMLLFKGDVDGVGGEDCTLADVVLQDTQPAAPRPGPAHGATSSWDQDFFPFPSSLAGFTVIVFPYVSRLA